MQTPSELRTRTWRKSSYSAGGGGNCLEVADHIPGTAPAPTTVPVRDSKRTPHGPVLIPRAPAWTAFVTAIRTGAL
ncbi:DUF397 domain-containing protein [Streptomyces gamaensis]|uniref:DUF397 domain-containing protein n=1 Tax=Streptomyces gamaensis TaxID=1763542 RepID=A0ABW0YU05_9ACTN